MQLQSCMLVAPRVWCSHFVYGGIPILHFVRYLDTRVDMGLSIKHEGQQSCSIFGPHLHNCRKLRKCTNHAALKLHACRPSRLILQLCLWRYPNMSLCALFGYEGRHRFEHQTRGGTIMHHVWAPFGQVQWIYEGTLHRVLCTCSHEVLV